MASIAGWTLFITVTLEAVLLSALALWPLAQLGALTQLGTFDGWRHVFRVGTSNLVRG